MISLTQKTLSFSFLALLNSVAHALDPHSFELGYFDVAPTLSLGAARNDNIFRDPTNQIDTIIWTVSPSIQAVMEGENNIYTLQADLFKGIYADSPADDYFDWQLGATAQRQLTARSSMDLSASLFQTHEDRGTGFSEIGDLPDAPSKYQNNNLGAGFQYVTPASKGKIRVDLSYSSDEYDASTLDNNFARDSRSLEASTTLTLSVIRQANFLLQYRYRDIDYELDSLETQGSQDSIENYVLVGMEWEAGSKLSGSLMAGRGEKNYASPQRQDQSTPSWNLDIQWRPYSYSRFSLSADESFSEAFATGDSITDRTYSLGWEHNWTSRFGSSVTFSRSDADYGGTSREDQTDSATISFNYAFRRWLDLSLSYRDNARDSNDPFFKYNQRVFSLGIQTSL